MPDVDGRKGGARTAVLLNAGAGLYVGGSVLNLYAGVRKAARLIDSGLARQKLDDFLILSQRLGQAEKVKLIADRDPEDMV